jgi:hypothetical protein
MRRIDAPFRPLPHDEFNKLSTDEKILYLTRAMETLAGDREYVFLGVQPSQHDNE